MKIKKELIAIMDNKGHFVHEYNNNKSALAYSARWIGKGDIASVLTVPVKAYKTEKEKYEHMAKMLGGQLVKIEAEYEVKTLDGKEPEIVEETKDNFDQTVGKAFAKFMASKFGGLD